MPQVRVGGSWYLRFLVLNLGQSQADGNRQVSLLGCVLVTDTQLCGLISGHSTRGGGENQKLERRMGLLMLNGLEYNFSIEMFIFIIEIFKLLKKK